MNISVYFYKEDGSYDYMDMIPLEFDSEGVQVVPENSTAQYPPDLSTDPRFSEELNKWVPQVEVSPFDSITYLKTVEQIREEFYRVAQSTKEELIAYNEKATGSPDEDIEAFREAQSSHAKRLTRLEASLERTRYYLTIVLPHAKHYFEN